MEQKLADLHATAIIAEVERQVSIAPDILLGHCVRLRFDLYLVRMVVAPSGTVASTDRTLAYVDVRGKSGNCDCDGAAVAAGADRRVCRGHVVSSGSSCSFPSTTPIALYKMASKPPPRLPPKYPI